MKLQIVRRGDEYAVRERGWIFSWYYGGGFRCGEFKKDASWMTLERAKEIKRMFERFEEARQERKKLEKLPIHVVDFGEK